MLDQNFNDRIRAMTKDDLALVLAWRNHPDVRRFMYTRREISLEEHLSWFDRCKNDECKYLLIFEIQMIPQGFVQFTRLNHAPTAEWGFYIAPGAPKGAGCRMGHVALRYAFQEIYLHKICGQVLSSNEQSIRFHRALGFQQEGILRDHYYDEKEFHDVVLFGLLETEWQEESCHRIFTA